MATCLICGKDVSDDISYHNEIFHSDSRPETPLRSFLKGFLPVSVPVGALALLSTLGNINRDSYAWLWFVGALLWLVLGLVAIRIGFSEDKGQFTLPGILAGLLVGFLLLGGMCVANLNEVELFLVGV